MPINHVEIKYKLLLLIIETMDFVGPTYLQRTKAIVPVSKGT